MRLRHVAARRLLQSAEIAGERALLIVGQRLAVEHQHRVAIHARLDRRHVAGVERLGDIDAGHLAGEGRE